MFVWFPIFLLFMTSFVNRSRSTALCAIWCGRDLHFWSPNPWLHKGPPKIKLEQLRPALGRRGRRDSGRKGATRKRLTVTVDWTAVCAVRGPSHQPLSWVSCHDTSGPGYQESIQIISEHMLVYHLQLLFFWTGSTKIFDFGMQNLNHDANLATDFK